MKLSHMVIITMRKIRGETPLDSSLSFELPNTTLQFLLVEDDDIIVLFRIQSLKLQHQVYNGNSRIVLDV